MLFFYQAKKYIDLEQTLKVMMIAESKKVLRSVYMITCAVMTSVLGCIVTTYLFFRYTWCLDLPLLQKSLVFALFVLIGCIPLFVSYQTEQFFGKFYPYYRYVLYFVFISCIILFSMTLAVDAVLWLLSYTPLIAKLKFICCYLNYILIGAALLCSAYALYAGVKIPAVKEVAIVSEKIKNEHKIVVLSDIHIHRAINPEKVKGIVEKTNALEPDIILLVGDIIDDDIDVVAETSTLLKGLKAKKGIYFVTGNHEFYSGYKETVAEMKKFGFLFLENGGVSWGDVYLAGIPDLFSGRSYHKNADIKQAFAAAEPEQFRLLMSHTPADFGKENNFDLEVSGHTHGGQIFPFHVFAKLHNKYLAGLYEMENGVWIYVSRGAGQWGPQMRFLASSEISLIKLIPQK